MATVVGSASQASQKKQGNSVVKAAMAFAFGTLVSRFLGLIRDALLARTFDKQITDAYLLAFRFPNLFRRLFGEGALSACFIPLYMEYKEKGDRKSLGQLTAGVLGLLLITLLPFSLIVSLTLDWTIPMWVGEGFDNVPGKTELTVIMTKIMFPFLILVSVYAYLMALLNVNKKFLLSSVAAGMLNISVIGACLWYTLDHNLPTTILAWAVIVGGFFQFIILIPALRGLDIPFTLSWSSITSLPVKRTLRAFLPSVLGLGIIQIMAFINGYYASSLAAGAVSYIYYADRLLELPLSLIAVSLGTAMLPSLSEAEGRQDRERFKTELLGHLQVLLFLCIPSAFGMWMTADLSVTLFFERGAFTSAEAESVAAIVKIYAITVVSASISRVMAQAFYATKDTMAPSLAALAGLIVHVCLAPFFMEHYQVNGLVASTAIASVVNMLYLFVVFTRRYGSIDYFRLMIFTLKCSVAGIAIALACAVVQHVLPAPTTLLQLISLLLCVALSTMAYFGLSAVLKVEESRVVLQKIKRRFSRR